MPALPTFETDRLLLKGVTAGDIPAYKKYFVDEAVIRNLTARVPWPYPEEGVEAFVSSYLLPRQGKDLWAWGLFLKENPWELIGAVELRKKTDPDNRGFWLGRAFWGRGLMTEALRPITDYAFSHLGFEKLTFTNAVGNDRSSRIKKKTGATLLRREPASFVDPAFTMREVWELTKEAWEKISKES